MVCVHKTHRTISNKEVVLNGSASTLEVTSSRLITEEAGKNALIPVFLKGI